MASPEAIAQARPLVLSIYASLADILKQNRKISVQFEALDALRLQFNSILGVSDDKLSSPAVRTVSHDSSQRDSIAVVRPSVLDDGKKLAGRPSVIDEGKTPAAAAPSLKLFAKLPKQIVESGLVKPELMRLSAVYELIETELDYCKDLQTMITVRQIF
jgi:hypothetical protein